MSSNPESTPEEIAVVTEQKPTDEGLPLDFPLTPEDVQDEAIRGDFVIRWAIVLLALLMGFALIDQTMTLVHVKSGEYLIGNGILPPRGGDPFSATAEKRTWFNLSWLFDLLVAGAYGAGSWIGISVLKGLLVAATFWQMVRISRPKLPTWWGSICVIPALVACQPRMTALPEIMTLLGVALTLRLLHEWKSVGSPRSLWLLVPLFFLWSNFDNRVYLGVWLLVLTAVGEALTRIPAESRRPLKPLLTVIVCAIAATFVHPFPGGWLIEPWTLHQQVYPSFRTYAGEGGAGIQYFQVASREFFSNPSPSGILGLLLLVMAGMTMFLNRKRLEVTDLLWFFGFAVVTVLSVHELAAASLVFCAIATLNGQNWYENRFSLEYTTDSRFLLLSRGGRAVTVLSLFSIALFVSTGGIRAPGGARLGVGLSPELAGHVASYERLLATSHGDRGFDFNPAQGDLLIWVGKKPFIDQRLELYTGQGAENLIDLHLKTRDTFRISENVTRGMRQQGLEDLKKYQISFAIPRLTGFNPDYATMVGLLSDPNWRLQRLGASTAVFYRYDPEDLKLVEFLEETQQIFTEEAFRKEGDSIPSRAGWPTPPTVYEKYLWGRSEDLSPESLEGQHLMQLASLISTPNPSMAYLAIRRAQQALGRNPNDVLANIVLGEAYTYLGRFDTSNQAMGQATSIEQMRYLQALAAYHHALIADPDQVEIRRALYGLYRRAGKIDLALRELQAYHDQSQRFRSFSPAGSEEEKQTSAELERLQQGIREMEEECERLAEKVPQNQLGGFRMSFFYGRGLILKAMQELEMLPPEAMSNPEIMQIRALCLLEAGRTEEAYDLSGQLEGMGPQLAAQDWRGVRTISLLTNGEYDRAIQLWEEASMEATRNKLADVLFNLSPHFVTTRPLNWPVTETEKAWNYFNFFTNQISSIKLSTALTQIEEGENRKAGETLHEILDQNPETPERRTIAYYLTMIQQTPIDPLPPSERVPVLFAPEADKKK